MVALVPHGGRESRMWHVALLLASYCGTCTCFLDDFLAPAGSRVEFTVTEGEVPESHAKDPFADPNDIIDGSDCPAGGLLAPDSDDVYFLAGKDIRNCVFLVRPTKFTWLGGISVLCLVPCFFGFWYWVVSRLADGEPQGGARDDRVTMAFQACQNLEEVEDEDEEDGQQQADLRWSLHFSEKETELKFVHDNAREVCRKGRIVLTVALFFELHMIFFNADQNAVPRFMPIFTSWNSSARVLFTCSWLTVFAITSVTLWLTIVCSNDRRKHYVERILMSWCFFVCSMLMTLCNRYLCAKIAGESPRRAFTHYFSDDSVFNQIVAVCVFISVYTPVRHHLMVSCCAAIFVIYVMTCLAYGSADGALWNIAFGQEAAKLKWRLGWIQISELLWLALLLTNLLVGQRSIETRRRQDFMALINSQKIIDELKSAEDGAKGSSALERGRNALETAIEQLTALQEHRVITTAGLAKDMATIAKLVEEGKKALENADRLFHFSVSDALEGAMFDEYRDNKDIHGFVAMTGAARATQGPKGDLLREQGAVPLPKGTSRGSMWQSGLLKNSLTLRPTDMQASKQEIKALQALEGVGSDWDFDPLDLARETGNRALAHVAEVVVVKAQWRCSLGNSPHSEDRLRAFVRELVRRYPPNDYHNEAHAATVAHMAFWFATETGYMDTMANDIERMALMLSALGHDVGHFGRNNMFILNSRHTLAMLWNDASVLENMHTAAVFNIADKEGCQIFGDLKDKDYKTFRRLIISFILTTDLKNHQESIMKFSARQKADDFLRRPDSDEQVDRWIDDKEMLGRMIMQSSDIGHAGLNWEMHKEWSFRILCEFFEQGDEEKRMGLPVSPLCERKDYNIVGNQKFFIDFIARSCINQIEAISRRNDHLEIQEEVLNQCDANKKLWTEFYSEKGAFDSDNHSILACGRARQAPNQPLWPYVLPSPLPGMRPVNTEELLTEVSAYRPQARNIIAKSQSTAPLQQTKSDAPSKSDVSKSDVSALPSVQVDQVASKSAD